MQSDHVNGSQCESTHRQGPPRKRIKVTRACDACKARKAKCSGTLPCNWCSKRGLSRKCRYDAKYGRGRATTPPSAIPRLPSDSQGEHLQRGPGGQGFPSVGVPTGPETEQAARETAGAHNDGSPGRQQEEHGSNAMISAAETTVPSRASPALEAAEIQGQYHDSTSGFAFLHRAWKRLSKYDSDAVRVPKDGVATSTGPRMEAENEESPVFEAGDKPLGSATRPERFELPSRERSKQLLLLYFDVCMATYQFLHPQTVLAWLDEMVRNKRADVPLHHGIGRARAAIVLTALAIAAAHEEKSSGRFQIDEQASVAWSDEFFSAATALVQQETASPTLESAQARLVQVLYLLTTSRMNQGWYVFGTLVQLISALGLHRRAGRKSREAPTGDYIVRQLRIRTFWTAYILDNYLGVIFGRPRHYHDEEIDQDLPETVKDEDMTPAGPNRSGFRRGRKDCTVQALIYHSKIASIVGEASRTVYSVKAHSVEERAIAAETLSTKLRQWRASLPPHLGTVNPSSLIPHFRRQAITLRLSYCHAMMHINRVALLRKAAESSEAQAHDALMAAREVLEIVDELVDEGGPIFNAFWWTHYVTFCALVIVYVREVQRHRRPDSITALSTDEAEDRAQLLLLAESCHGYLEQATASNSPSRRYSIILEELKNAAESPVPGGTDTAHSFAIHNQSNAASPYVGTDNGLYLTEVDQPNHFGSTDIAEYSLLEWQSDDWLDLDSMAFGGFMDGHDPHNSSARWDADGMVSWQSSALFSEVEFTLIFCIPTLYLVLSELLEDVLDGTPMAASLW